MQQKSVVIDMLANTIKDTAKWVRRRVSLLAHDTAGHFFSPWPVGLRHLKRQGFEPRTVFDVGVADGTPDLYAAFPNASYYLFEPVVEAMPHLQRIGRRLNARIFNIALGAEETEMVISVRPHDIGGSSLFEEVGSIADVKCYPVPVWRFDQVITEFARPALCKIDVQGAEFDVLRGMGERIHEMDVIIVESSVIATIKHGPEISDIVGVLKQKGFALYDVLGHTRRPLDKAMAQLDLVFVKADSPFRADRRWSAAPV